MFRFTALPVILVCLTLLTPLAASAHAGQRVLFDEGHGQRFLIERTGDLDLSRLAATFREAGYDVASTTAPLTDDTLAGIDVLVVSGAFHPYTPAEIDAIATFVGRGGRLGIMLHIGPPVSGLLDRFGIVHSNGVIREQENIIETEPINFQVTRLEEHPLFKGIDRFSLYGVWALKETTPDMKPIALTSPSAWIDLNGNGRLDEGDARQSFAVAVAGSYGKGVIVAFGDDAIFQNKFLTGNNLTLGRNMAAWLGGLGSPSPKTVSTSSD